jgi:hypothetical protein
MGGKARNIKKGMYTNNQSLLKQTKTKSQGRYTMAKVRL